VREERKRQATNRAVASTAARRASRQTITRAISLHNPKRPVLRVTIPERDEGKQKGQRGQKRQKVLFAFFALFALFASPVAFKNRTRKGIVGNSPWVGRTLIIGRLDYLSAAEQVVDWSEAYIFILINRRLHSFAVINRELA